MDETVVSLYLLGVPRTGPEFPVRVLVGKPRPGDADWACPVAVAGLYPRTVDIYGADALQALVLGLRLVAAHLIGFTEAGGRLLFPDDRTPFPLEAYFPTPEQGKA